MKMLGFVLLLLSTFPTTAQEPCARSRVTLITDSHGLGPFGGKLAHWLKDWEGFEQHYYILGGSSPWWWMKSWWPKGSNGLTSMNGLTYDSCSGELLPPWPRKKFQKTKGKDISELLPVPEKPFESDMVILVQGSNVPGSATVYKAMTRDLTLSIRRRLPESHCVWVGPPKMRLLSDALMDKVYVNIKAGLADADAILAREFPESKRRACQLIDSRPVSKYPPAGNGDGVHYPFVAKCSEKEISRLVSRCRDYTAPWAEGVIEEIKRLRDEAFRSPASKR